MGAARLTPRLAAVAGLIPRGARVIDVGSDHGVLPAFLAENRLAARVFATDVREAPLARAKRTAEARGVADRIEFYLADGLPAGVAGLIDVAVVAGMGGETIAGIVARAPWLGETGALLILQPQSKLGALTASLRSGGYALTGASLAEDGGRVYTILTARASGAPGGDLLSLLRRDPLLPRYLDAQIARLARVLRGMERSGGGAPETRRELDELRALRAEL
jgi:tRNA (adenine22-N1)-methyltransferase